MKRFVIDARMYNESGIGRYIRNLIENLQRLDKTNQYFILFNPENYDRLVYHSNFQKVLADFKWYGIAEQIKLPRLLNSLKPDLIHFPHFNVPIFYRGKFVVTIHDLIHQHFQMKRATMHDPLTYRIKQLGYKTIFKNALSKSTRILVPSNYVKDLLIKEWKIKEVQIVVTPEAVDDNIVEKCQMSRQRRGSPLAANVKCQILLKKLNIKQPYIFYVGNAHPHKNVEGLIKAFLKLKERYPDLKLVLSGYDHYFWQRLRRENSYEGIIYTGYVDDEQLVALYKNALCFVQPSFEEGFGIPLLEAMALGCPVVSSNAGSLQEVGGDGAIYFDPYDLGDMGDKVDRVINDKNLRNKLIEKGKKRAKLFSWEKLAEQTLKVYEEII